MHAHREEVGAPLKGLEEHPWPCRTYERHRNEGASPWWERGEFLGSCCCSWSCLLLHFQGPGLQMHWPCQADSKGQVEAS